MFQNSVGGKTVINRVWVLLVWRSKKWQTLFSSTKLLNLIRTSPGAQNWLSSGGGRQKPKNKVLSLILNVSCIVCECVSINFYDSNINLNRLEGERIIVFRPYFKILSTKKTFLFFFFYLWPLQFLSDHSRTFGHF